jgi:macrolide transport system ATP-binding/permease protein
MGTFVADLRHGLRLLTRSPSFAAVAILSLGLGIGANTAIFSVVNGLLLRPMPVAEPDRLVSIYTSDFSGPRYGASSYPDSVDFAGATPALSGIAASRPAPLTFTRHAEPERVFGEIVSPDYFDVLGVGMAAGRAFTSRQLAAGEGGVIVSHRFWQRRLGGDPSIVGRSVKLNGQPFTVLGVAPASYTGVLRGLAVDVWVPLTEGARLSPGSDSMKSRGNRSMLLLGRLRPEATIDEVRAQLAVVAGQLQTAYPDNWTDVRGERRRVTVLPESAARIPPEASGVASGFLAVLSAIVGIVLIVACANVAGLLAARGAARRHEIAVRLSLGASRSRLIRQLLTEATVLAVLAGVFGLVVARWTTALLANAQPPLPLPLALDFPLDGRVLAFSIVMSLVTGVVFGLVPALHTTGGSLLPALKKEVVAPGRSRRFSLRNALVVGQVAMSLLLLVVGGLFILSLQRAYSIDTGFESRQVLLASVDPSMLGHDDARGALTYREILDRVQRLPGVQSAAIARVVPLSFEGGRRGMRPEGYTRRQGEDMEVHYNVATESYFATLAVPVVRGRDFERTDRDGSEGVIIVNEAFAQQYWPGQDPLQRRISVSGDDGPWLRVVGVVRNTKYNWLNEDARPIMYLPFWQHYASESTLHVKSTGPIDALVAPVREAIRGVEPTLPVLRLTTLEERTNVSLLPQRIAVGLTAAFGSLALLLAAMGLYGVLAQSVTQRTREIGIRLALGAGRHDVLQLVLRQGLVLVAVGAVIGLGLALGVTRFLATFLYGVSSVDPLAYAGAWLVLAVPAALAMWLPARRATAVDPAVTLRYE